jgi:tetratricopeptide (TPR) repeat protein
MIAKLSESARLVSALLIAAAMAWAFQPATALSAGSSSSSDEPTVSDMIDDAEDYIDDEDYNDAIEILQQALLIESNNPDVLNYLGYSHRKLGQRTEALQFYQRALSQDPEHLGANEYLGELYLEMDLLPKAEERLAVLADACDSGCEEFEDLEEAIAAYKEMHGQS